MSKTPWLNMLLGGISGAGQGIAAQQDYRRKKLQDQQDTEIHKLKLEQLRAPKAPELQYDPGRGGVVNVTGNTFTPTPGITPRQDTPQPPHTIETSRGIFQYDPVARKWAHATDPSGNPLQPRPTASQLGQNDSAKRAAYVRRRLVELTKPTKVLGGLTKPGMSMSDAIAQAGLEYDESGGTTHAAPQGPTESEKAEAARNPAFKAWLASKGHTL